MKDIKALCPEHKKVPLSVSLVQFYLLDCTVPKAFSELVRTLGSLKILSVYSHGGIPGMPGIRET